MPIFLLFFILKIQQGVGACAELCVESPPEGQFAIMPEATIQSLTTNLPNEEPFIGDGDSGEIATNQADGRVWVFDESTEPVELGGACVRIPLGSNLYASNHLDLDVTNPENLPIPVPNPLSTPDRTVRTFRILMRFVQQPLTSFASYFDYEVDWGNPSLWNPDNTPNVDNPIDLYASLGSSVLVEMTSYGPMPKWLGRVIWAE